MVKFKNLLGMLFLLVIIYTVGLLFPYTLVLGKAGLVDPNIAERISFYANLVIGFGIATILILAINLLWKRNDEFGDNIGFFNIGEKPGFSFFKRFTAFQLTLGFNIIVTIAFFVASLVAPFKELTGLRVLPQQFSAVDSLSLSSMMIPIGENLMAQFAMGVLLLVLTIIFIVLKIRPSNYRVSAFALVMVGLGTFGAIWHNSVYPNSTTAGFVVFVFWAVMAFLTLATGLWTIGWSLHFNNNFFIDFGRLVNTDIARISIGIWIAIQIALYVFLYREKLFGKSNKLESTIL